MSPRSERSSASLPSKPPALISTPTSSPTPLTVTVTAPPATVPSTVGLASRSWAFCELLLHLLGLLEQGVHVEAAGSAERLEGVLGHGALISRGRVGAHWWGISSMTWAPSSRCEQLGAVEALVVGVEVVGVGVGVGGGQVVGPAALGAAGLPGLLDARPRAAATPAPAFGGARRLRRGRRPAGRGPPRRSAAARAARRAPRSAAAAAARGRRGSGAAAGAAAVAAGRAGRPWRRGRRSSRSASRRRRRRSRPGGRSRRCRRCRRSRGRRRWRSPGSAILPSTPTTWQFWVRCIQVTRRRCLVASTMSGHRRRTSTRLRPPAGAAAGGGCGAGRRGGAAPALGRRLGARRGRCGPRARRRRARLRRAAGGRLGRRLGRRAGGAAVGGPAATGVAASTRGRRPGGPAPGGGGRRRGGGRGGRRPGDRDPLLEPVEAGQHAVGGVVGAGQQHPGADQLEQQPRARWRRASRSGRSRPGRRRG